MGSDSDLRSNVLSRLVMWDEWGNRVVDFVVMKGEGIAVVKPSSPFQA